eukprot:6287999-Amphidinium_carterae.1
MEQHTGAGIPAAVPETPDVLVALPPATQPRVTLPAPTLSIRVSSATCAACLLNFGRRARVRDHLRDSRRCAAYVMEHEEAMTPTTFADGLSKSRGLNKSKSGMLLPEPGRKPRGERPPTCGGELCRSSVPVDALSNVKSRPQ